MFCIGRTRKQTRVTGPECVIFNEGPVWMCVCVRMTLVFVICDRIAAARNVADEPTGFAGSAAQQDFREDSSVIRPLDEPAAAVAAGQSAHR